MDIGDKTLSIGQGVNAETETSESVNEASENQAENSSEQLFKFPVKEITTHLPNGGSRPLSRKNPNEFLWVAIYDGCAYIFHNPDDKMPVRIVSMVNTIIETGANRPVPGN